MIFSLETKDLTIYLNHQLKGLFLDHKSELLTLNIVDIAKERISENFKRIKLPYYRDKDGNPFFNHKHNDHYLVLIYECSRVAANKNLNLLATNLFSLNKILHGIDLYFEVELPLNYIFIHPVGTVVGRADFNNKIVIYQGVTIGSSKEGKYPSFNGENIIYSNASVLGNSKIGKSSSLSSRSTVINRDVPNNSIFFGSAKDSLIKSDKNNLISEYFL